MNLTASSLVGFGFNLNIVVSNAGVFPVGLASANVTSSNKVLAFINSPASTFTAGAASLTPNESTGLLFPGTNLTLATLLPGLTLTSACDLINAVVLSASFDNITGTCFNGTSLPVNSIVLLFSKNCSFLDNFVKSSKEIFLDTPSTLLIVANFLPVIVSATTKGLSPIIGSGVLIMNSFAGISVTLGLSLIGTTGSFPTLTTFSAFLPKKSIICLPLVVSSIIIGGLTSPLISAKETTVGLSFICTTSSTMNCFDSLIGLFALVVITFAPKNLVAFAPT